MKLLPYCHQVTGHSCLLTTEDKTTICKVLSRNEFEFYLNMDCTFRPFTPEFRGVVNVTVCDERSGEYKFEADFSDEFDARIEELVTKGQQQEDPTAPVRYRGLDPDKFDECPGFESNEHTKDKMSQIRTFSDVGRNPWVRRFEIMDHTNIGNAIPYILLENLGAGFIKPCVLDLKIGKKQGGWLSKLTTTSSIFLRLAGLQVFQNGGFLCRDKFYGRGLSCDGLKNAIKMFFSGETRLRKEVMSSVIIKISQMKAVVSKLDAHRLYGCSIVIVYEGGHYDDTFDSPNDVIEKSGVKSDVRVVDFGRSSAGLEHENMDAADDGFVSGLSNLLQILKEIADET